MKRFLILLIFQVTSVFAAESLCETALTELHTLKLDSLENTDRVKALILKTSYDSKMKELSSRSGISVAVLETAVLNAIPANNIATNTQKNIPVNPEITTQAEIERLFRKYDNYEEMEDKAHEFADFFITKHDGKTNLRIDHIFNEFIGPKAYKKSLPILFLFLAMPSKFLPQVLVDTIPKVEPYLFEDQLIAAIVAFNDMIQTEFLIKHFKVSTDELLYYFIRNAYDEEIQKALTPTLIKTLIHDLIISTIIDKRISGNLLHLAANHHLHTPSPDVKKFLLIMAKEILKANPQLLEVYVGRNNHETPVFFATGEMLKLFIQNNANLNHQSAEGNTPLHKVVRNEDRVFSPDDISLLLNAGANPNIRNSKNLTPRGTANALDNNAILDYFTKHGVHD